MLDWMGYKRVDFNLSATYEVFQTSYGNEASLIRQLSMCVIIYQASYDLGHH